MHTLINFSLKFLFIILFLISLARTRAHVGANFRFTTGSIEKRKSYQDELMFEFELSFQNFSQN